MPKERAANPRWYEIIVSRRREQDFRGVRKEPGALHKDPLVQGKDQRRAESKETERSIELTNASAMLNIEIQNSTT